MPRPTLPSTTERCTMADWATMRNLCDALWEATRRDEDFGSFHDSAMPVLTAAMAKVRVAASRVHREALFSAYTNLRGRGYMDAANVIHDLMDHPPTDYPVDHPAEKLRKFIDGATGKASKEAEVLGWFEAALAEAENKGRMKSVRVDERAVTRVALYAALGVISTVHRVEEGVTHPGLVNMAIRVCEDAIRGLMDGSIEHPVVKFAGLILHGDVLHRRWLRQSAEQFVKDGTVRPPPRTAADDAVLDATWNGPREAPITDVGLDAHAPDMLGGDDEPRCGGCSDRDPAPEAHVPTCSMYDEKGGDGE